MRIVLYEASNCLLNGMSDKSSRTSRDYLERLGVEVNLDTRVMNYNGTYLDLSDGSKLSSKTVIWAAGIKTHYIKGFSEDTIGKQGRFIVDRYNRIRAYDDIFALGDNALMSTPKYPNGHPQVAQVAIQQAGKLAKNLSYILKGKEQLIKEFEYKDKGSMATIGRNLAVADLPNIKLKGFVAWLLWSFVHLFTIFGLKNKVFTFLNWSWNYLTYDQSLRVLIRPKYSNKPAYKDFQSIEKKEVEVIK
jgi:NADH dehydrogenase